MKTNLFCVTIKKANNATETFFVKGYSITEIISKTDAYIQSILIPGVEAPIIEEVKLTGKILI